jgi:hypothetical protein
MIPTGFPCAERLKARACEIPQPLAPALVFSAFVESPHCRSYSPLFTRLRTVNPAFLASDMERVLGELKVDKTLRTGFLQAGQCVKGLAESGRRKVNRPPQTLQSPSHNSYS